MYSNPRRGGGMFGSKNRTYHSQYSIMNEGMNRKMIGEALRVLKTPNMYLWGNWKGILEYLDALKDYNLSTTLLSWHKTNPAPLCSGKYLSDTEYCLFVRDKTPMYGGYNDHKTYWIQPYNGKDKKKYNHPTIKPLDIIEQLIRNSSLEGQTVMDPYLGSGTTAVACKKLNRNFIGCEINKTYYETSLERLRETV